MKFLMTVLALAAFGIAGCGGSSGGGSSGGGSNGGGSNGGGSSTSSSQPATSISATTSAAATTAAPTFAGTSDCQALVDMAHKYVAAAESSLAGGGHADFGTLLKADQAMADASPSAIHSDAEYVVHTFTGFISAMGKIGFKPGAVPTASQIAALAPLEAQLKTARFAAAVDHIRAWAKANCHGVS